MSQEVNPPPTSLGIGAHLRGNIATVRKLLDDLVEDEIRRLDLTIGEADVLTVVHISADTAPAPKDLADWLLLTTAGVAGRLNALESRQLIERRSHPSDGRRVTVHLTEAGETLAAQVLHVKDRSLAELLLSEFGQDESESLIDTLDSLIALLRTHQVP